MRATAWLREHSSIWGVAGRLAESLYSWLKAGGILAPSNSDLITQQLGASNATESKLSKHQEKRESVTKATKDFEVAACHFWPIADALISAMNDECRKHNVDFLVVRMPGRNGYVNQVETDCLKKTADKLKVPFCDITNDFPDEMRNSPEDLFYAVHFTAKGHRIFADRLIEFIRSEIGL